MVLMPMVKLALLAAALNTDAGKITVAPEPINLDGWLGVATLDYPMAPELPLKNIEIEVTVSARGKPLGCWIVKAEDPWLGTYACNKAARDGQFLPARDIHKHRVQGAARIALAWPATRPNKATWITADDYPPLSMRNGEQGAVEVEWDINTSGRVENCHVVTSSGFPLLDQQSCNLLTKRALYRPAKDQNGRPIRSTSRRRIRWTLPK